MTLVAALARIPFLGRAPGPDEAGFLLVGGQWDGAGSSLYGDFWVDRPPLLVSIFRLASSLGGLTALRLTGVVAVVLLVAGSARTAKLIGSDQAGRWSAVVAAVLCLTPVLGGYRVNGELLAAPFVVGGILAVAHALRSPHGARAARFAALAGGLAICAILVKQNMADVAVFGAMAYLVAWRQHGITRERFFTVTGASALGAVAAIALAGAWTIAHGTSLSGVYDAMYPFRFRAGTVLAASGQGHATARLFGLLGAAATSGLGLLVLLLGRDAVRRRRRDPLTWALVAMVFFAAASVLVGGNYWHHYLIQLVVPVSIAAGLLAAERRLLIRPVVMYAAIAAVIAWSLILATPMGSPGQSVGTAVGAVSKPGDTIVSAYGHADIVQTSGLTSPYANLWSLPVKTLDPQLTGLNRTLTGPSAPTWVVTGSTVRSWGLDTARTSTILARDYRQVSTICGRTIHLHVGVIRSIPRAPATCSGTDAPIATIKELHP